VHPSSPCQDAPESSGLITESGLEHELLPPVKSSVLISSYLQTISKQKSEIAILKLKVKSLERSINRLARKKDAVKTSLKAGKKTFVGIRWKSVGTQADFGSCAPENPAQNLLTTIYSRTEQAKPKKYTEQLKEFSLKLHFYSPKAYNFLRSTFMKSLPHPRSLSIWVAGIDTKPGEY
jgi:hypothetical protein